jgi:glycosyltransferase involved in cell wall biosynthesis
MIGVYKMQKLVSVIMSTFNEREVELRAAIESILNQSYKSIELILVLDNPANDLLKSVLFEYQKNDDRVKIIINEINIGLALSLNKAIELAKGQYIARMDADDISFENRIANEITFLEKNKSYAMVATNKVDINEEGAIKTSNYKVVGDYNKLKSVMRFKSVIIHPSIVIRKSVLNQLKGYRNFETSQDYDLWLRLISENHKIMILNEKLIYYRIRSNSISLSNPFRQYLYHKYAIKLYKQRIRNGNDEFSEENKQKFLENHDYFNEDNKNRFNKAFNMLYDGIYLVKNKKVISGIMKILYACGMHIEIYKELLLAIKFKFFLRTL